MKRKQFPLLLSEEEKSEMLEVAKDQDLNGAQFCRRAIKEAIKKDKTVQ